MRYRTMIVIILFFYISLLVHYSTFEPLWKIALGIPILLLAHLAATSWNDWADYKIDQINLIGHADRPLAANIINREYLFRFAVVTNILTFIFASFLGLSVLLAVLIIQIINIQYSLPPLKLSHRQWVPAFYLPIGYMGISMVMGWQLGSTSFQWPIAAALYFLFVARISLKDLRDRKGDLAVGKKTLILSYGKKLVCSICAVALVIGGVLLISSTYLVEAKIALVYLVFLSLLVIYLLYRQHQYLRELLMVGLGARIGNGILLTYTASLLIGNLPYRSSVIAVFFVAIASLYTYLLLHHILHPEHFRFGRQQVR